MDTATRPLLVMAFLAAVSCGGDDDGGDGGASECTLAADCDDGVFCNGAELCDPLAAGADERGCVVGASRCLAGQACDEASATCRTDCARDRDADGDGHDASECGGSDCDDSDPGAFPGNAEICDPANHDDDCDPITFGVRDADADGFPDARCCNVAAGGAPTCGDDCDDARAGVSPALPETCDAFDNDCDTLVDEGVERSFYPDLDGDGFGDEEGTAVLACIPPDDDHVENRTDCDDMNRAANPATTEVCEPAGTTPFDNDCDGAIDEAGTRAYFRDRDDDGFGDPDTFVTTMECTAPSGFVPASNDCDDSSAATSPAATESCDRMDTNCSLPGVMAGGVDAGEDSDDDGHSPLGAGCTGGFARDDCDDTSATTFAGAEERCDGIDNDCAGAADDEPGATAWCGPGTACAMGVCEGRRALAGGSAHGCALASGAVHCWGENNAGQLGVDTATLPRRPTAGVVPGTSGALELCAAAEYACVRTAPGTVLCWGRNDDGQLGRGTTSASEPTPASVSALTDAVQIACGYSHTCARRIAGEVVCWGANGLGQLGDGSITPRSLPAGVSGLTDAVSIGLGAAHGCARRASREVVCWGDNRVGQLGNGTTSGGRTPVPVTSPGDVRALALGVQSSCALDAAGVVRCWGANGSGQLGDGSSMGRPLALPILAPSGVVTDLVSGSEHVCAGLADGSAACWGSGNDGQVGNGFIGNELRPVGVVGLAGVSALGAGGAFTCARDGSGNVRCWGQNRLGQLGDGGNRSPAAVVGIADATDLAATNQHVCVTRTGGGVTCWGAGIFGQLGDGLRRNRVAPFDVPALSSIVEIATGAYHTCARDAAGPVSCWGSNSYGQLGDGTTSDRMAPTAIAGFAGAAEVEAGAWHTCARFPSGGLQCTGRNDLYQLGDGTRVDRLSPVDVPGVDDATALDTSANTTCAIRGAAASAAAWCWGENRGGQVGMGSVVLDQHPTPIRVVALTSPVADVSIGAYLGCAIHGSMADVACWGENGYGGVGDGSMVLRASPVPTAPLIRGALGVAGAVGHSCAFTATETSCWGQNLAGQLGDGTGTDRPTPMVVPGAPADVAEIATGNGYTCVLRASGGVMCWGANDAGQLGRGVLRAVQGLP